MKRIDNGLYTGKLTGGTKYFVRRINNGKQWQLEIADTIMLIAKHKGAITNYIQRMEGL